MQNTSRTFVHKATVLFFGLASPATTGQLAAPAVGVSNLNESGSPRASAIGNDGMDWQRIWQFTTGSSVTSFDFTGIAIEFNAAHNAPSNLPVGLYSSFDPTTCAGVGNLMTSLTISTGDPLTAGLTPFSGAATLLPSTNYFLALSATGNTSQNYYSYLVTSDYSEDSGSLTGWSIADGNWNNYPNFSVSPTERWSFDPSAPVFAVYASAVPEPSTYAAFAGIAMLGFAGSRRRRRTTNAVPENA